MLNNPKLQLHPHGKHVLGPCTNGEEVDIIISRYNYEQLRHIILSNSTCCWIAKQNISKTMQLKRITQAMPKHSFSSDNYFSIFQCPNISKYTRQLFINEHKWMKEFHDIETIYEIFSGNHDGLYYRKITDNLIDILKNMDLLCCSTMEMYMKQCTICTTYTQLLDYCNENDSNEVIMERRLKYLSSVSSFSSYKRRRSSLISGGSCCSDKDILNDMQRDV